MTKIPNPYYKKEIDTFSLYSLTIGNILLDSVCINVFEYMNYELYDYPHELSIISSITKEKTWHGGLFGLQEIIRITLADEHNGKSILSEYHD
jgi:hypothetical protein